MSAPTPLPHGLRPSARGPRPHSSFGLRLRRTLRRPALARESTRFSWSPAPGGLRPPAPHRKLP